MLSDSQRHRLKQEKENLERQHQLLSEKIVAIELDVISQANTAIKFQNQRQVVEEKKNLSRIHDRLEEIENLIREDDKLIELAKFPDRPEKQPETQIRDSGDPSTKVPITIHQPGEQPEESENKLFKLFLSFLPLLLVGSLGGGLWFLTQSMKPNILDFCNDNKKDSLISCRSSNNTIDTNNKEILRKIGEKTLDKDRVYTIAVVIPGTNARSFISEYILEGVAKKQADFNNTHTDRKIFVLIASEVGNIKGQPDGGLPIAKKLVEQNLILGVVGPYSSSSLAHVVNTYCQKNLSLVSPTATTSIEDLKTAINTKDGKSEHINLECFFRVPETNDKAVDMLIKYLEEPSNAKQYKKVAILSIDGDTHAISFLLRLKKKINSTPLYLVADKPLKDINQSNAHETGIKTKIKLLKQGHEKEIGKTAIFLIQGAKYSTLQDTTEVVESNNGNFLILGNNSVYDPELLDKLNQKHEKNTKDSIRKIIIAVPSFTPKSNKDLTWHVSMSSDATQILIDAIEKESSNGKRGSIEREGVQKQFNNDNFEIQISEKIIKLKGIGLKDAPYDLIQPNCSTSPCKWEKINLDDKPKQKSAP
jgi:ABC-type branched-subunit amino acid transport system substrate-binding protein